MTSPRRRPKPKAESKQQDQPQPQVGAVLLKAPDVPVQPLCNRCKLPVGPIKAILTSKAAGSWKCRKCNTRGTPLHMRFGRWPPANFNLLSSDDQAAFWQKAHGADNAARLENVLVETLTTQRVEQEKSVVVRGVPPPFGLHDERV